MGILDVERHGPILEQRPCSSAGPFPLSAICGVVFLHAPPRQTSNSGFLREISQVQKELSIHDIMKFINCTTPEEVILLLIDCTILSICNTDYLSCENRGSTLKSSRVYPESLL